MEYRGKEIEHAAVEADEWPALVDPIDNPELYNCIKLFNYSRV